MKTNAALCRYVNKLNIPIHIRRVKKPTECGSVTYLPRDLKIRGEYYKRVFEVESIKTLLYMAPEYHIRYSISDFKIMYLKTYENIIVS